MHELLIILFSNILFMPIYLGAMLIKHMHVVLLFTGNLNTFNYKLNELYQNYFIYFCKNGLIPENTMENFSSNCFITYVTSY